MKSCLALLTCVLLSARCLSQAKVYDAKPCDSTVEYENHNMVDYTIKVRHLRGRVVDPSNIEIPRVCVAVFNSDHSKLLRTVESDDEGNFAVDAMPSGKYWFIVKDQQRAFCAAAAKVDIGWMRGKNTVVVHMAPRGIDSCSFCEAK